LNPLTELNFISFNKFLGTAAFGFVVVVIGGGGGGGGIFYTTVLKRTVVARFEVAISDDVDAILNCYCCYLTMSMLKNYI
jgi:hypothetical protein